MSHYTTFDLNVQCEEGNAISEAEYAEVMAMMAEESNALNGYGEWLAEVESRKDWLGSYTNRIAGPTLAGFDI